MTVNQALLYVRVSSKEQEKEGYSLDAQEKLALDYACRKYLKIKRQWKVSESAWKQERKAFNQMIEYSKRHDEIKHIIFDITDRMTRNDFDKLKIYILIKEHDKTIHFTRTNKTINKYSDSDEEFMFDIEVAVAKKMSNDISKKVRMGMQEKAEQGLYPSIAPFGYQNDRNTKLIVIDKERAKFVKTAFHFMATGSYSFSMIADKLNESNCRTIKNKKIGKSALANMLKNPIYYGAFIWRGILYQGTHEPTISKSTYDKVQQVLCGKFHPSKQKTDFVFNNLIICGVCNCKVSGERKKNNLPLIGLELEFVENRYQALENGTQIHLEAVLDGTFVGNPEDGVMYKLQERFDEHKYRDGSEAQLKSIKKYIIENDIEQEEADRLLNEYKKNEKNISMRTGTL